MVIDIPHPSDLVGLHRILSWSHLNPGEEYEMEFISYYTALPYHYATGGYVDFAAKVLQQYEIPDMEKDELIRLSLPYRAFITALFALPPKVRTPCLRNNLGEDNLYIKFVKMTKLKMVILSMERRANTDEMKKQAKDLMSVRKSFFGEQEE